MVEPLGLSFRVFTAKYWGVKIIMDFTLFYSTNLSNGFDVADITTERWHSDIHLCDGPSRCRH